MTLTFRDFKVKMDARVYQAFVKCEAEGLLRKSKLIQADLNELVVRQAPQNDRTFQRAIDVATTKLATKLTRSWAIEDATKVRLGDPTFAEYHAFTNLMDCLVAEGIAVEDIVSGAIQILGDELGDEEAR